MFRELLICALLESRGAPLQVSAMSRLQYATNGGLHRLVLRPHTLRDGFGNPQSVKERRSVSVRERRRSGQLRKNARTGSERRTTMMYPQMTTAARRAA